MDTVGSKISFRNGQSRGWYVCVALAVSMMIQAPGAWADDVVNKPPPEAQASAPPAAAATDGKPKIVVDATVHDFGTTSGSEPLKHSFIVTNKGTVDLHITNVRPSCGCTVTGTYPNVLKPGESGALPFTLNVTNMQGDFAKSISITCDDPTSPQVNLVLKGKIKRPIEIVPPGAFFGGVYGDKPQTKEIRITSNLDKPLSLVLDPFASEGPFRFELKELVPGKEFQLNVTTVPPYPAPSTQRTMARILTNIENQRELSITAMANAQERLACIPTTLFLPAPASQPAGAPPAQPQKQVVRFSNNGDTAVKVLEAQVDDPAIKTTVNEHQAGKVYLIYLDIPAGHALPAEGRKLSIRCDDPEKPVLEVPMKTYVVPAPTTAPAVQQAHQTPAPAQIKPPQQPQLRPAEMLVGQKAQPFELTTLAGKPASTDSLKGSVAVVNFFAVNCGFCKKQLPRVEALRQNYESKGVRFLYLSETMRKAFSENEIKSALAEMGVKGEVAVDKDNKVGQAYRANGYPTMVVLDKEGTIIAVNIGNRADLEDRLKGQLDALLAGKAIPDEFGTPKQQAQGSPGG